MPPSLGGFFVRSCGHATDYGAQKCGESVALFCCEWRGGIDYTSDVVLKA